MVDLGAVVRHRSSSFVHQLNQTGTQILENMEFIDLGRFNPNFLSIEKCQFHPVIFPLLFWYRPLAEIHVRYMHGLLYATVPVGFGITSTMRFATDSAGQLRHQYALHATRLNSLMWSSIYRGVTVELSLAIPR